MVVYDSLGAAHSLTFQFNKTAANAWNYSITIPAAEVGASGAPVSIGSGILQFDGNGQLASPATDITGLTLTGLANGASDLTFDWRLFNNGAGLMTQMSAASNVSSTYQDGFSSGSLLDFNIGGDGVI
jgi:flagellar hook protein FlgE